MKIRSALELGTALDNALAWRKKEITTIILSIKSQKRAHINKAIYRAFIPILYAHWEGYAKDAFSYYIEFVFRQRLFYSDLTSNFIAISCWSTIKEIAKSNQFRDHNQFIDFLTYNQGERAKIPKDFVDTESNLSSKVLQNLLYSTGIPYDNFWQVKSLAIDGKLLHYRNKIVHGERFDVDEPVLYELHDLVIDLMSYIKNSIENSAILQKYRRNKE